MTNNSLSAKVMSCIRHVENERKLLAELRTLVDQYGDFACQEIFKVLTSMEFDVTQAAYQWYNIQQHIDTLSRALPRQVNLLAAMCDYLANCQGNDKLYSSKLISIAQYEQLVNDSTYGKLTGLLSRNSFQGTLNQQLALAKLSY